MWQLMLLGMLVFALASPAHAEVYKCPDGKGGTVLRDMPCEGTPHAPFPAPADGAPSPQAPVQRLSLQQYPRLAEALRTLHKLRAATEVGITRLDYGRQLVEAKTVIDEAVRAPADETGHAMQTALGSILQIYLDALTAWRMVDEGVSLPPQEAERFKRAYHLFDGRNFTKDGMLSTIWAVARYRLDQLGQVVE